MISLKKYVLTLQLDSTKEAEMVGAKEGYGHVNVNQYTEDLYRNNKVQITIPTRRTALGALFRSWQYSKMGILNCVLKQ